MNNNYYSKTMLRVRLDEHELVKEKTEDGDIIVVKGGLINSGGVVEDNIFRSIGFVYESDQYRYDQHDLWVRKDEHMKK